jgi:hypothetical protein
MPATGRVISVDIPATVSGFHHRHALVYLPPVWFRPVRPQLPAVVMLAGTPGLTSDWTRAAGADRTADDYARAHHGWAPILVFADHNGSDVGDTECVDGPRGNAETYLTRDVRRFVVNTYDAAPDPSAWAVAGFSEGGMCALTLTLRHSDAFHTFADFSGDARPSLGPPATTVRRLFGGSVAAWVTHDPRTLLTHERFPELAGRFEVGTSDAKPLAAARTLFVAARAAGVDAQLVVRPGGHHFRFWAHAFRNSLPWIASHVATTTSRYVASTQTDHRRALDG